MAARPTPMISFDPLAKREAVPISETRADGGASMDQVELASRREDPHARNGGGSVRPLGYFLPRVMVRSVVMRWVDGTRIGAYLGSCSGKRSRASAVSATGAVFCHVCFGHSFAPPCPGKPRGRSPRTGRHIRACFPSPRREPAPASSSARCDKAAGV